MRTINNSTNKIHQIKMSDIKRLWAWIRVKEDIIQVTRRDDMDFEVKTKAGVRIYKRWNDAVNYLKKETKKILDKNDEIPF